MKNRLENREKGDSDGEDSLGWVSSLSSEDERAAATDAFPTNWYGVLQERAVARVRQRLHEKKKKQVSEKKSPLKRILVVPGRSSLVSAAVDGGALRVRVLTQDNDIAWEKSWPSAVSSLSDLGLVSTLAPRNGSFSPERIVVCAGAAATAAIFDDFAPILIEDAASRLPAPDGLTLIVTTAADKIVAREERVGSFATADRVKRLLDKARDHSPGVALTIETSTKQRVKIAVVDSRAPERKAARLFGERNDWALVACVSASHIDLKALGWLHGDIDEVIAADLASFDAAKTIQAPASVKDLTALSPSKATSLSGEKNTKRQQHLRHREDDDHHKRLIHFPAQDRNVDEVFDTPENDLGRLVVFPPTDDVLFSPTDDVAFSPTDNVVFPPTDDGVYFPPTDDFASNQKIQDDDDDESRGESLEASEKGGHDEESLEPRPLKSAPAPTQAMEVLKPPLTDEKRIAELRAALWKAKRARDLALEISRTVLEQSSKDAQLRRAAEREEADASDARIRAENHVRRLEAQVTSLEADMKAAERTSNADARRASDAACAALLAVLEETKSHSPHSTTKNVEAVLKELEGRADFLAEALVAARTEAEMATEATYRERRAARSAVDRIRATATKDLEGTLRDLCDAVTAQASPTKRALQSLEDQRDALAETRTRDHQALDAVRGQIVALEKELNDSKAHQAALRPSSSTASSATTHLA